MLYLTETFLALFQISAGELSTQAAQLEEQLSVIFQIASHWNAILLEEADVYVEANLLSGRRSASA